MSHRRTLAALLLALGCVACDQGTKRLAVAELRERPPVELLDRTVRLLYAENRGAWGSLGATWPQPLKQVLFVGLPLVVLGLAAWTVRQRAASTREVAAMALLVGGGVGNIIDRVTQGYVVDFVHVGWHGVGTNIFNVADVAVVAGVLLLLAGWRPQARAPAG